jgi:5'-3' exonuclease
MGVPGFFSWLLKNKKKLGANNLILNNLVNKIGWLMIDTNCLLHPCVANILEKYKEGQLKIDNNKDLRKQIEKHIWNKITECIDDMIEQTKAEYIFIAIDGVAPMGKILQQRQRRYRFLFDKKIKLNEINTFEEIDEIITKTITKQNGIEEPILPLSSIELTPGTDYMERINNLMISYINVLKNKNIKCIYSSYHDEGEGEHKILQYIKNNLYSSNIPIVIYGLDADLLFLSLGLGFEYDLYVMREKQVFSNKEVDLDEIPEYNYVEIKQLHILISNLKISTNDFIVLCYLIGNDFLPGLLTTDVKKGGLYKIFRAWNNIKEKKGLENKYDVEEINMDEKNNLIESYLVKYNKETKLYNINLELLKGLFEELLWTEKYIWKNINRDKFLNQDNLEPEEITKLLQTKEEDKKVLLNKFIKGQTMNTDFLDKIEFSSSTEYYSYYLGINSLNIDKSVIKKMVMDYIGGIEWCLSYYFDKCPSWTWGYNFMVTPLIKDIINYFPQTNKQIKIKYSPRTLNPVEQLILAIPPQTYKYVIEKELIDIIKQNKNIGYMLPESFQIDINKEHLFWKCQVKIPIVEYEEFEEEIKKINILNEKNKIYSFIKNY